MDFASEVLLSGHEAQQRLEVHLLHGLRRGTVELPGDVVPLRVDTVAELDRVLGFACLCLVFFHHGCQVGGSHPHLTTHAILEVGSDETPTASLPRQPIRSYLCEVLNPCDDATTRLASG